MPTTVADLLSAIESFAPSRWAFDFDSVGLQVGSVSSPAEKVLLSLDRSMAALDFAIASGHTVLLTHHPLFLHPIGRLDDSTYEGRFALKAIQHQISVIAAHTNWDAAPGGVNDVLASKLGLLDVKNFGSGAKVAQTKMVYTVPSRFLDATLDEVTAAGAGVIGNYRRCAFYVRGTGTFEALEGANPAVGRIGFPESVEEVRVELVLSSGLVGKVVNALKSVHPYETPAIDLYSLESIVEQPCGRVGRLPSAMSLNRFKRLIDEALATTCSYWGESDRSVEWVAVVGGAADGEWRSAQAAGADVLVTGEVKQHTALEASESGFVIVEAGHYETEHPSMEALKERLETKCPGVSATVYQPKAGCSGRRSLFDV